MEVGDDSAFKDKIIATSRTKVIIMYLLQGRQSFIDDDIQGRCKLHVMNLNDKD